jgi:hypothetical protein
MKAAVRLYLSSMAFGIAIAIIYWFSSREPAGTLLLGIMATALSIVAGYIVIAEREADLAGDKPQATNTEYAGERVGLFTLESGWPFVVGLAALSLVMGVLLPWWGVGGLVVLLFALFMLVRESR